MNTFSVGASFRFAWETFKKRPGMLIGGFLLAMGVSGLSSTILSPADGEPFTPIVFVFILVSVVIGIMIEIGLINFALRAHDDPATLAIADLWNPKPFWPYLGAKLLVGFIVLVGIILVVIPGIIAALGLMFSSYLIIDKGKGPIEAIKESWRITTGHKWRLLLFMLAIMGLNILGVVALIIGLVVTIPVTMLALAHAYRTLAGRAPTEEPNQHAETAMVS